MSDDILAFRILKHCFTTFLSLASNLSRDRFNRPAGTGYFPHDSRHIVPGYYLAVPPGQRPFAHRSASHYLSAYGFQPKETVRTTAESLSTFGAENGLTFDKRMHFQTDYIYRDYPAPARRQIQNGHSFRALAPEGGLCYSPSLCIRSGPWPCP